MREEGGGRSAMPIWSDTQTEVLFSVGETIYSGDCPGTVVAVDTEHGIISVEWSDDVGSYGAIKYSMNAPCLRKKWPWE